MTVRVGPSGLEWPPSGDWQAWAATWEARMQAHFPRRRACIDAILEVLAELLPAGPWRLLDLGAGTGSLSHALLDRFPQATVVALDLDPVLLTIGRGHLGDGGGRLTWSQADLRAPDWPDGLQRAIGTTAPFDASKATAPFDTSETMAPFDAVVSLATLHHFSSREVGAIYAALARLVRPGALVLNGEDLADGSPYASLSQRFRERRRRQILPSDSWWEGIRADPALAAASAERDRLRDRMRGAARKLSAQAHRRLLRKAGFAEAVVAWRHLDEALVVGRR